MRTPMMSPLAEVARVFLRLGATAFGGPAAHIGVMEDECVRRRGWLSSTEFVDLVSASNLIPGPNSTELAMHIGHRRAGWRGLWVAGLAFLLPATVLVWGLAMAYVRVGHTPWAVGALNGVQPIVLAVVVHALWRLRAVVGASPVRWAIALGAVVALTRGLNEVVVLLMAGVVAAVVSRVGTHRMPPAALVAVSSPITANAHSSGVGMFARTLGALTGALVVPPSIGAIFMSFLKIGSVLFGSGYVLLALMRAEFVTRHGWITEAQLLDAIAVGQLTPGPLFASATFVGFVTMGHGGALAATVGIFLPAFCFVAVSGPLVPMIRRSPTASAVLDGVNVGSLALLAAVVLAMAPAVATSGVRVASFLIALVLLLRATLSAGWLLTSGAAIGIVAQWLSRP